MSRYIWDGLHETVDSKRFLIMSKLSNREKIIIEGLRVVHEYGYTGASVRDISRAAGVPLGSFTNHFSSKEAFGLEILDRYHLNNIAIMEALLGDKSKSIKERLNLYFDHILKNLMGPDLRSGCLVGNLCAEVANQSDVLRVHLAGMLEEMRRAMYALLDEGMASGELPAGLNTEKACGFICCSVQGAILVSKVLRSASPIDNCRQHVMRDILKLS